MVQMNLKRLPIINFASLRKTSTIGNFCYFSVLRKTGLDKFLDENEVYTLFAPNDAAFEKLKPELRAKFMKGDACAKSKFSFIVKVICS